MATAASELTEPKPLPRKHEGLIGVAEVAQILGVSPQWVRRHAGQDLPAIKVGDLWRFREAKVIAWLERREIDPDADGSDDGAA